MNILFYFAIFSIFILHILGNWTDQLSDYDVLQNINIRVTRDATINKRINLVSKYRKFNLILKPTENLFANDFKSVNVDRNGRETPVFIDYSQYYEGFVSGADKSSVRAFLGNDKMVSINIVLNEDIYQVESLSRYEHSNSSFIIYRFSDLKTNGTKGPLCPTHNINGTIPFKNPDGRYKRSVDENNPVISPASSDLKDNTKKFCTIKLVADYRFYKEHSKGEDSRTHNYLIELIDNINQLFKNTEFVDLNNNKYLGFGFIIKEIKVHSEWSLKSGHYNEERSFSPDSWLVENLLNSFGYEDHSEVCLAHLFTYQSFTEGTLGLAWIGSWKTLGNGGICSERINVHETKSKAVNTAWSTYKDGAGNHLVSLSAYLVTAHELGHNWGADHDPDTADCSPNAKGGGKYVMYTYSVVGYEHNNRVFSPCSKRNIGQTIATRLEYCFKSSDRVSASYCGNSRVDENEDCDSGRDKKNDFCCTEDCRFQPAAVCSPYNHECCTTDCKIETRGKICATADPFNPCLGNAVCSGTSKTCSPPTQLTGPNCTEHGQCKDGKCTPYCESIGKEPCICDKIEEACLICCRNLTIKECRPAKTFPTSNTNIVMRLNEGRPCARGVCENGVCKRRVNKLIERIWKIIDNFNPNLIAAFLLDNLVGTVIILSLVLWIPASIMVSCHDAKNKKATFQDRNRKIQA